MAEHRGSNGSAYKKDEGAQGKVYYSRLYRRLILLTLLCSVVPLLLVGWGINIHYTRFAKSRMMNSFRAQVDYHQRMIELFLKERRSGLQLIGHTNSRDYLAEASNLAHVFQIMKQEYGSITDLGIINGHGRHIAYIGPYDLMDKDYSGTFWFREVMKKGVYISDMFMGFRKIPHFIIAVTQTENGEKWILRATIDTQSFRSIVENVRIGKTGEVYLLNRQGIFQTSPRFSGKIMEKAPFPLGEFHEGTKIRILESDPNDSEQHLPRQVMAQTWLKEPRWLLVVKQNYSEAFNEVNHANYAILIFLHLSALAILIASILITRHLIKVIKRRDVEADQLNKQLLQAGKLASVGELSAGVAHEINNPLAIILTERQILLDLAGQFANLDEDFKKALVESLSQIDSQVLRCKRITQNLLRFSRRTTSVIETVDLNKFIGEVVELMEREAKTSGIKFISDLEGGLPPLLTDPSQLQQVFLNMITNAVDAHDGKSYGTIRISTRPDDQMEQVKVVLSDTGSGIPPEDLEKIFDPFFTTKSVGKGTGLGLSICYSIIKRLGGDITVQSELGRGTEFTFFLPYSPPPDLLENINEVPEV
ncbi:MAG: two-component sensor histidine kinase [Desulfobacteraceae bacterium]|nr:two-component sensor histidine kinase [Desulfobacteraceae bacterium]